MNLITFHDGQREHALIRAAWEFPTAEPFTLVHGVANSAAAELTGFYERRANARPNISATEERDALQRGNGALEALTRERLGQLERALAFATLQTLATREKGLAAETRTFDARVATLAAVQPWNEINVQVDRWALDVFASRDDTDRRHLLAELREGQHPELAAALLRAPSFALAQITHSQTTTDERGGKHTRRVPVVDDELRTTLRDWLARRANPDAMTQIDQLRHAAEFAGAAWTNAAKHLVDVSGLDPKSTREALGPQAFERYSAPPRPMSDQNWPLSIPGPSLKPRRKAGA